MIPPEMTADPDVRLTPSQQRVMRYISRHYDEAIFLTAARLAGKVKVSEATVVRLAQALGYSGYPEWQRKLREELRSRLSTVARLRQSVDQAGSEGDVLANVLQEDIRNITETLRNTRVKVFREAVDELHRARRVFTAGLRGSYGLAVNLTTYLRFLGKEAQVLTPGHGEMWDMLHDLGRRDLVIGISLRRYTRLSVEVLEFARRRGARVGAITDSPFSPLARPAHWVLTAQARLESFIESFTAATSLVNALLTALSVKTAPRSAQALKKREALWEEMGVYIPEEE